ncbi:uncharacterized protein BCR38DRAFT_35553 [Pseudomassariella vexata]|uniref:Uncharacterized protein n=1 Tax=Pseudomassariella vexata TaxID=1141098 RepID=A0A1Y2DQC3_9PEZI|nr:uncharacterized protein BCR38DRAFT_35553 [Pseudomassariella vexata]ORY61493.1 hypothetical protein BCR38DRAFT_35553 [Pseudomassariella vexata]
MMPLTALLVLWIDRGRHQSTSRVSVRLVDDEQYSPPLTLKWKTEINNPASRISTIDEGGNILCPCRFIDGIKCGFCSSIRQQAGSCGTEEFYSHCGDFCYFPRDNNGDLIGLVGDGGIRKQSDLAPISCMRTQQGLT